MIDYYKLINLSSTATFNEIKGTIKNLRFKYESEISEGINSDALQSQLDLIIEAQETLLDAEDREAYDEKLASAPKSEIIDPFASKYFDYDSIRISNDTNWKEIVNWQGEVNIDLYRTLLESCVRLPYPDFQSDILLAAILTPSALAKMLPIVFSFGVSGSGKSQISNLVSKIWGGGSPLVGTTSFATLRRKIGSVSTIVHNSKTIGLNNAICWDDLSPELLRNEHIYSLLKSACNRATSIYRMPKNQTDTEMIEIQCFGQRYVSSIYPFFSDSEFIEMNRRMLIIECKKSPEAVECIDFESVNWDGLNAVTNKYWEGDKALKYVENRKQVVGYAKTFKGLAPERSALCTDLLTTGLTMGVWAHVSIAFGTLKTFYRSNDDLVAAQSSPLRSVLSKVVLASNSKPILASALKGIVDDALKLGLIDGRIKKGEITNTMRLLGYELNVDDRLWYKR
jgi:hypothetical protein